MRRQAFDVLAIGGMMRDFLCVLRPGPTGAHLDRRERRLSLSLDAPAALKTLHVALGGKAANAAVACARLGLRTGLVSAVGRDEMGTELMQTLKRERVDMSLVAQVSLEQTGIVIVLLDESSQEQTHLVFPGANRLLEITEDVQKTLHMTQWVILTSLGDTHDDNQRALVQALEKEATRLAFVPGVGEVTRGQEAWAGLLGRTSLLVMTDAEATAFVGRPTQGGTLDEIARDLLDRGPETIVLTQGVRGATAYTTKEKYVVPPAQTSVADTVGAGDAFAATVVAGLLMTEGDVGRALSLAALNAASVVSASAAQQGLLARAVLEERLRRSPVPISRELWGS